MCLRDLAGQLVGLIGMSTVEFGMVPLGAPMRLTPKHGFWIFDESRVVVETINTELSFDTADDLDLYGRTWDGLNESAAYGARAHRIIVRARHLIAPS
ncbi:MULTISPECIES: Scr1 family TA system antitoxin-like transcriptional regulator [Streptomyces albovinaceus subgroup]|uniref:Scr1 family TA system antitoxin-like transcriptional regulator n=1 Tax=Streptomyces albovinaceus subgroup TaxID=1482558 RepID=UPI001F1B7471|nr:Scr1 family TA system antitoxin-like transcriptional regulator [Streptomyces mediolani]